MRVVGLGLVSLLVACGAPSSDRAAKAAAANAAVAESADAAIKVDDNVVAYTTENPEIKKARAKARETLPRFDQLFAKGEPGTYTVKFPLTQNGETEHIWLAVSSIQQGMYIGSLANAPVNGTAHKVGDAMIIKQADIEDWMVMTDAGIYGGYAARYQIKDMPADKRREIEDKFLD